MTQDRIPQDLSDLLDAPLPRLVERLVQAGPETDPRDLGRVEGLLLHRTLHLLRQASRDQIVEESLALDRFLDGEAARPLRDRHPRFHARCSTLADLLTEAAQRTDHAAAESIVRAHATHGPALLRFLRGAVGPVPRAHLREQLGVAEAQLSRLLRDFEEADLIVRYRPENRKEVLVELGPAGRARADAEALPAWVEVVVDLLEARTAGAAGTAPSPEDIARRLREGGLRSDDQVRRIAQSFSTSGRITPPAARRFVDRVAEENPGFRMVVATLGASRPAAGFAPQSHN
ncbi:MAG: winged helix-turn-helix transcriptional regulator [Planctomycetes bacterium]|nr:winged helix-turn-helix transcriptional regulator [Planctomycetota bacterium]